MERNEDNLGIVNILLPSSAAVSVDNNFPFFLSRHGRCASCCSCCARWHMRRQRHKELHGRQVTQILHCVENTLLAEILNNAMGSRIGRHSGLVGRSRFSRTEC
jgi:hypothetical protein